MENPAKPEVNPYSEIWPLEHKAEIWGHRPTADVFESDPPERGQGDVGKHPSPTDQYYGIAEICAALGDLSKEQIQQMQSFAHFRLTESTGGRGQIEVGDLFIDAAIRTIERKRKWKRGISRFNHFIAVMRSIGHQRLKQAGRFTALDELVAAPQNWSLSALDAQTGVARLREKLRGDAIALNILESMMDETRPRDTQRFLGISAEVYWAARKRIRRQAENLPGAPRSSGARAPKRPSLGGTSFKVDESHALNAPVPMPYQPRFRPIFLERSK